MNTTNTVPEDERLSTSYDEDFSVVASIVDSEYHVLNAVEGKVYPGLHAQQTQDIYYHLHMSGYVYLVSSSQRQSRDCQC